MSQCSNSPPVTSAPPQESYSYQHGSCPQSDSNKYLEQHEKNQNQMTNHYEGGGKSVTVVQHNIAGPAQGPKGSNELTQSSNQTLANTKTQSSYDNHAYCGVPTQDQAGGNYKSRKHKSRKHKSRKHKSRKHKSRKHKSRKHKSRNHKSRKHKSRKHKSKVRK